MSEEIQERHKKEIKELQSKIQALKKAVPKGDKKAKKRSTEEIALVQKELTDRHAEELSAAASDVPAVENLSLAPSTEEPSKKLSKAEKRREAKAAAEQRKLEEISTLELDTTQRAQEHFKITQTVTALGRTIHEIPADGNCMFYALQHQLECRGVRQSVEALRDTAARFMCEHEADFLPYLVHPNTGDMLTSSQFISYCQDIRTNGVWGGMHEAHAISEALAVPIEILQADVPPVVLGERYEADPIILLYYKHKFGLGEHYDSVT